ncbi:MAG: L,D-transpeptidase family protein [Clostridiales bacterium]|nr:L,D-transpeptidase family protein [Clostridiales bacterium]
MKSWKCYGARIAMMALLMVVCLFGGQKTVKAAALSLLGESSMKAGNTVKYVLLNAPEEAEVVWTTSNEEILQVEDTKENVNTVVAVGAGTATITAAVEGTEDVAELTVSVGLNQPELGKLTVNGADSITVNWTPVSGADGYRIYRKTGTGVYKYITDVAGEKKSSWKDSGLTLNQTYTYTVKAYAFSRNDGTTVIWSTRNEDGVSAKTKLAAPVLKEATVNSSSSVKVKWKAVTGAESYNVYRKYGNNDWKKVANTKKTSYVDDAVVLGTTYTYTIRAVSGSLKSGYDKEGVSVQAVPMTPELVETFTKGANSLEISWKSVDGVIGYRIFRRQGDEKWKRLDTVKGTSYVDTTVKYGEEYDYTVRAYTKVDGKNVWSWYDEDGITGKTVAKSEIKLPSPVMSSAKSSSYDSITVTWKAAKRADGYVVYRRTNTGNWKKLKVLTGNVLSYKDTTCKFAKKYFYTVRSYVTYDDSNVLSVNYDNTGVGTKTTLDAPELKSAESSSTSNKIVVKWGTVAGAEGYRLYRKTAKTDWKRVATITGTSYTDNVSTNDTYYYTVRAYRKVDGEIKLGEYNAKGIKAAPQYTYKYKNGLKLYYDSKGNLIKDVENIIGKQDSYYIMVNKSQNIVTVYAKDENGKYVVPVKAFICSTGADTPVGTFKTPAKYRWHELMGPCWGQWCTRINGGVLFHSVYYNSYNDNMSLSVTAYNKLGTQCSHGCVRLTAGDAKWIYDNCDLQTTVKIYNSSEPEPFGKPTAAKLSSSHTWDPTDPYAYESKCKKLGCH